MILLLVGPSGSGKKSFKRTCKDFGIRVIKSCTTKPKKDERDEEVYKFLTDEQFNKLIRNDELLEWVTYNGHKYGTLRNDFTKNCVTIVDKDAMHKILRTYAGKAYVIFFDISEEECRKSCLERGEDPSTVEQKITNDRNRLKNFDARIANMIITDNDLGRFKEILKENASKWVVR
jgi:guanylate kinase